MKLSPISLSTLNVHGSSGDALKEQQSRPQDKELGWCPKPSLFYRSCCYALPIFHPYGLCRLCWDVFILLALIYTATEIPLTLSFEVNLTLLNPLGIIAFSIDIVLLLDVLVNFRTCYYDKWDRLLLHTDPYDIARKYLKGWFWLDVITSFPFEFIIDPTGAQTESIAVSLKVLRVFRLFRILRILRVIRVMKMFDGITKMMDIRREMYFVLKLAKIMGAMVLSAHYFACIWWWVGVSAYKEGLPPETNDDGVTIYSSWIQAKGIEMNDTLFVKYSASWYWAIVTLFTTGYGDITAHNPIEQWVCSFCILAGSCFFAYFIGTLTSWVAEGDRVRSFEIQKVEEAQAFCRYHKFSRDLSRMILTHIRYYCNYNFVFESDEIIPLLPPFLQRKVNKKIAKRYLSKLDLFRHLPKEVIGQIALTMHSVSCNANRYLYKRGDVALCLYIQRTGEAKLKYTDGTPSRKLHRGDVIGERALISGKRRDAIKVVMWSEFFVLSIENIRGVFRNCFKPKRFKHEWNSLKRKIKMDQSRHIKATRRCNLDHSPKNVTRKVVHDLSKQGDTIRSEFMDTFLFKSADDHDLTPVYQRLSLDEDDADETPNKRDWFKSCALDLDDTIYLPKKVSNNTNPDDNNNISGSDLRKYGHKGASRSIFSNLYPFDVRQNSERRNKKVMSDTATTAFGRKVQNVNYSQRTPITKKMQSTDEEFEFSDIVLSDQLDIDDVEDDDDSCGNDTAEMMMIALEPTGKKRADVALAGKKGMGKFGAKRKGKRSSAKTKKKVMNNVVINGVNNANKESKLVNNEEDEQIEIKEKGSEINERENKINNEKHNEMESNL